jgi:hypothetical protein
MEPLLPAAKRSGRPRGAALSEALNAISACCALRRQCQHDPISSLTRFVAGPA